MTFRWVREAAAWEDVIAGRAAQPVQRWLNGSQASSHLGRHLSEGHSRKSGRGRRAGAKGSGSAKGGGRGLSDRERAGRRFGPHWARISAQLLSESIVGGPLDMSVPLFFKEESPLKLMQREPPFGYNFHRIKVERVKELQRNATVPQQQRFGTCAVVGNSGTLLLRELGDEIDAHDAVFRVNHAPVPSSPEGQKYVKHAGAKTTWRIVTSRWFDEEKKDPSQTILALCDRPFIYSCQNLLFESGPKPRIHNVNPLFYAAVRRHTGDSKIPLAGLVAAAIALKACASVDVYGLSTMRTPEVGQKVCAYYYQCNQRGELSDLAYHNRPGDREFHDFEAHARTLEAWNESKMLRIQVR